MTLRVTAELPGSGGVLLPSAEDFEVHEVLAYEPSGAGEHLFIELEKVDLDTMTALERICRALGVSPRDAGYAGMKDKRARARQWISVPARAALPSLPKLEALASPQLRVLRTVASDKKLRRGHQRANRFRILLREVPEGGVARAQAILARLRETGVPNTFGPQRFGRDGDNATRALAFVRGEAAAPRDRRIRDLMISAAQSAVFNRALELRLEAGLFTRALAGDVMQKHDTGGLFDCAEPEVDQARLDRLEISPTAALPGGRYRRAGGRAQELEEAALAASGITAGDLERLGADGTRRALRYPLDPTAGIEAAGEGAYRLEITLPSGAYATVLLDELVKPEGGVFDRAPVG